MGTMDALQGFCMRVHDPPRIVLFSTSYYRTKFSIHNGLPTRLSERARARIVKLNNNKFHNSLVAPYTPALRIELLKIY